MRTTFLIAVVAVAALLALTTTVPVSTQIVPQMPDPCLSFVQTAGADIFLDGTGETLSDVGAAISLIIVDGSGVPIDNIPAQDIFLVSCDPNGNFVFDPPLIADGPTVDGGFATISGPVCGRGWSDGFAVVAMGVVLRCTSPADECLPIRVRSTDIDANGAFDLRDYAELVGNYPPAPYVPKADLNFDGIINLSDLTIFAPQWADPRVAETCQ